MVKTLVEELAFDVNEEGPFGSALRMAAASGRPMILQYLLNRPDCVREGRLKHALQGARYVLKSKTTFVITFSLSVLLAKWNVSAFFLKSILK